MGLSDDPVHDPMHMYLSDDALLAAGGNEDTFIQVAKSEIKDLIAYGDDRINEKSSEAEAQTQTKKIFLEMLELVQCSRKRNQNCSSGLP